MSITTEDLKEILSAAVDIANKSTIDVAKATGEASIRFDAAHFVCAVIGELNEARNGAKPVIVGGGGLSDDQLDIIGEIRTGCLEGGPVLRGNAKAEDSNT